MVEDHHIEASTNPITGIPIAACAPLQSATAPIIGGNTIPPETKRVVEGVSRERTRV